MPEPSPLQNKPAHPLQLPLQMPYAPAPGHTGGPSPAGLSPFVLMPLAMGRLKAGSSIFLIQPHGYEEEKERRLK